MLTKFCLRLKKPGVACGGILNPKSEIRNTNAAKCRPNEALGNRQIGRIQKCRPLKESFRLKRRVLKAGCRTALCLTLALHSGCASYSPRGTVQSRAFDFNKDTLAYPNELLWEYHYAANGKWTTQACRHKPTYALHCFVVARTVRQFFENARFNPNEPVADEGTYRQLVRQVVGSSPRHPLPECEKVVIPGYPDLRTFSQGHESLLKQECGGAWQSYFQRGHWRMIFPFSRHQQEHVAAQLLAHIQPGWPVIVHLVRFPQLTINHGMVIFQAKEFADRVDFTAYDPNQQSHPVTITYDQSARTFSLPPSNYYPGGRVDLYEIFYKWDY